MLTRRTSLRRAHMRPSGPPVQSTRGAAGAAVADRTRRQPGPEAKRRAAKRRAEIDHRQAVKVAIWAKRPCCQLCHGRRWRERLGPDEMHEDPSRAKTRGLPPEERFNERVCGRLCDACHRDVTENRLEVVFADPVERFNGPVSGVPVFQGPPTHDDCDCMSCRPWTY